MLRYFVFLFIMLHGLIHLAGFSKAMGFAEVKMLTQPITVLRGWFWLLAAVSFIMAALLYFRDHSYWWALAAGAILVSQILIILYWTDAKYGTLVNLIILVFAILSYGRHQFDNRIALESQLIYDQPEVAVVKPGAGTLAILPSPVKKWLECSGAIGSAIPNGVSIRQKGEMRLKPGGRWMGFKARQIFRSDTPSFIWSVKIRQPFFTMTGRDIFLDGKASMKILLFSLFEIVNISGNEKTDEDSCIRYLAEMCWFPSAALADYIRWEAIDEHHAKATMEFGNRKVSGVFRFTKHGDILSFTAERHYGPRQISTTWEVVNTEWQLFGGFHIPSRSSVTWKLPDGDFTWAKVEIRTADYSFNSFNHSLQNQQS